MKGEFAKRSIYWDADQRRLEPEILWCLSAFFRVPFSSLSKSSE